MNFLDISKSGFAVMPSYAASPRGAQRVRELCVVAAKPNSGHNSKIREVLDFVERRR